MVVLQARAAREMLDGAPSSHSGTLVAAGAWRQEGVLHRDLANYGDSLQALICARGKAAQCAPLTRTPRVAAPHRIQHSLWC